MDNSIIVHDAKNINGFFNEFRFLSNFHPASVWFEGLEYISVENAYQASKTMDLSKRIAFQGCEPSEARKKGQTLELRPNWEEIKKDIMASICFEKFYRHEYLRVKLLKTGRKHLEETNYWGDTYWGVCNGQGQNNLGKILMGIRSFWFNVNRK